MKTIGNTVMITGAGTGMGLEAAKQFTRLGNKVIMVARNETRLRAEAAKLDGASAFAADISDEKQVGQLLRYIEESHPDLNMVLLNAAVTHYYSLFDDEDAFANASDEIRTNYLSTIRITQALEPLLSAKPESAMIITGSGVAFAPDVTVPTYAASKSAVHALVQAIRLTLQRRGSSVKVFELMAPLVDSPLAAPVNSDHKVPPAEVISGLIDGLRRDEFEMRPGLSDAIYQALRAAPDAALKLVNAYTEK